MNLSLNVDGSRNRNDDYKPAPKVNENAPSPRRGGLFSLFSNNGNESERKSYNAIQQIYQKHYTGQQEFSVEQKQKMAKTQPLQNLLKKAILSKDLKKSDDDVLIEDNKTDFPKELLEKQSKVSDPLQAFCDFKKQQYEYDFRKNSLQMQMFSHIKLELMPDIDSKVLKTVQSFEKEHVTTWKDEQGQILQNGPEPSQIIEQKDADGKILAPVSLPTMKNRQDMTSFTLVSLDDGDYAIQTIYDCVKQEHGIAFHKIEETKSGEQTLKKLQYFPTKKFENKIYTWVSDQYVSFKVIKDTVYFFTIGIEGKKDDNDEDEAIEEEVDNDYYGNECASSNEEVENEDSQDDGYGEERAEEQNVDQEEENVDQEEENADQEEEAEEPKNEEEEQAEDPTYNIQDKEQSEGKYGEEEEQEQEEDEQKEGGEQTDWKLLLNKFNLKTLKHKIMGEEIHSTENDKEKNLEPLAVFFADDFNAKTTSKQKEKDYFSKSYACILDVEFKIQPKYHYNYFNAGQISIISLNPDENGQKVTKKLFENSEYLINLWYPMKALKLSQHIIKSYNKTKDVKILDEKQEQILLIAFSDGQKNFESKQRVQKLLPNVIAAFQINDKEEEFENKIQDHEIPEHKEHYKDKKYNQVKVNTHKSFNDLLQFICFLNSSGLSWYDRTSKQLINQKITLGRNYNEFFKHLLYTTNYPELVPYKNEKNEIQQISALKYFKTIFDKNEKIYQNEGNMRDNIQILSSSVLTNKSSGFITIILHILQDTRESNTVIFKIKLKNWLVNTNQDILNNDANSFNKFFLECINSEKKEDDQQQVFLKPEVFQNSLLTISRYTNQVCRSFLGITQSKQQELQPDKTYQIDGLKASQCIVTYMIKDKTRDIEDATRNLSNNRRMLFIQDQEQIKMIQIVGKKNPLQFSVEQLQFSDQIVRKFVKPQKTIFECDDRLEVPVIAFNIENNVLSDITFAMIKDDKVLSFINLQQGDIKMNDNTHQQIGLAQSTELSEGKRKQNGQIITYYCQNFQALILDSANKLANIVEVQVKWIPQKDKNYVFDIETSLVGVKTIILNEEHLKIEIFPLFQRKNKKSKKDEKDDKSHLQICGTQLVLEIKREGEKDEDENSEEDYGSDSYGGSYSSEGYGSEEEEDEEKKQNLKTIYIHYNLRNPGFEESEFNFVNKFTKSRIKQIDDGLYGLISETWFNNELIQMSNQKIFNDDILMKILLDLHKKSMNCKLLDVHNFMNVSAFLNGMPSSGVLTANKLFQENMLKQFEACELYGGKSMIELTSDSKIIADTIQKLQKQNKSKKFDFEYISNPFTDNFCLNSIESALINDKDNIRYLNYQKQGLFFGKECIRMTMDYKSIIQLFLEKSDLKSAESLVKYLTHEMNDHKNMHSQIMSLMNIIIDKKWENKDIINVFLDLENNEEDEDAEKENTKKMYTIESPISSMSCSQNDLPDYMRVQLTTFPKEFDRAEVDDGYYAGKIKEQINNKKKSDEANGFAIKYSYLNVVDYAIQNRLNGVRKSTNNTQYLEALNEKFTQYDLSVWVKTILDMSVHEIENLSIIRDLIDYQFANTKRFYKFNLIIYVLFYVIPLVFQMFQLDKYGFFVRVLNLICLFTQIYFFLYEVIDMKAGLGQYFESIWNWIDASQFVFYVIYFAVRMFTSGTSYIPNMNEDAIKIVEDKSAQEKFLYDIMPLFNFIILAQSFFGLLFYMKIFKEFGKLVRLLALCVKSVSTFTVFLMIWVVLLSFLFKILGANFEDDDTLDYENYNDDFGDYRMMSEPLIYLIQTFRNSIGDISTPHYSYWWHRIQLYSDNNNKQDFYWGYFSIYLIWLLWFFEIYMMVIIMLNFLIAIVSQSYENVMSCQVETLYVQKSELTQEYMQCMDYLDNNGYGWLIQLFSYKTENFDYILIASCRESQGGGHDEWGGLVKTLKGFIIDKNGVLSKSISSLDQKLDMKIDTKINEVNTKIEDGFKQLKDLINEKSISN